MTSKNEKNELENLQKENQRLKRALEELAVLNEIATTISSTQSLDRILDSIIRKCVKNLQVEQCAVMLLDERKEEKPFQTMMRRGDTTSNVMPLRLDMQLTGWMLKNRKPLLINDFSKDGRFALAGGDLGAIHSLLGVPLVLQGRMIGILTVFDKKGRDSFSEDDQRLLSIIAAQSAQVIENARLLQEEQSLRQMQEELRMAFEIQTNLLPREFPTVPGYDFFGQSVPAKEVGGDYFDFINADTDRLAFCLGDVSGKGMPAALLMANLQAIVRSLTLTGATPRQCLESGNRLLYHCTSPEKFATLFYAHLELAAGRMTYANAGHNPPLLFDEGGEWRTLPGSGIVLGCLETFSHEEEALDLGPGELLVLYSDGISEAVNAKGEEFGEQRLAEVIRQHRLMGSREIGQQVFRAVAAFAGSAPQFDDITLLLVKRE